MIQRSKRLADKLMDSNKLYKTICGIINLILNAGVVFFLLMTLLYITTINNLLVGLSFPLNILYVAGCLGIIIRSCRTFWGFKFRWKGK